MSKSWSGGSDSRWRRFRSTMIEMWASQGRTSCELKIVTDCTGGVEQVDHIQPLSMGGQKYDPANCQPSCARCNRAKRIRVAPEPEPIMVTKW